jgi:cell volume regulation protein A
MKSESLDPATIAAITAALMFLGVLASKVSSRLRVPALLVFLAIGMLAGSEGIGGIAFDDHQLAQTVGVIALSFILFAGGLDTTWTEVRPVVGLGALLATVGVLITSIVVGLLAAVILDVPVVVGLLVGAIISSTDAAAVFSVLRSHSVGLRGTLRPLLELESGSNDPMAVFLTVAFLELATNPDASALGIVPVFVLQMLVGGGVGWVLARMAVPVMNRLRLEYDGLYSVVLIALVLGTFGLASLLGGSGFLAVYVAGIVLGNSVFVHKRSLVRFMDGLAWLMQISMFLVLGLLVFPSDLLPIAVEGLLVAAVLMFLARPLAVLALLLPARYGIRQSLLVSWVGLRGAVPIILATFPLVKDLPEAEVIFDVVFFVVLTSVLIQGTTIPRVASWLGVDVPADERPAAPLELVGPPGDATDLYDLVVATDAAVAGKQLVDAGLPSGALIVLIGGGGDFALPQGSSILQPGDRVLLLAQEEVLPEARRLLEGPPSS